MATKTGNQGYKVLHTPAWYAKDPEVATWVDEDVGPSSLHTCACDIQGTPICIGHDLGELRAFGIHIDEGRDLDDPRRSWRAADHEAPFDEEEYLATCCEAGAHHSLKNVMPSENSRFMVSGDLTPLAVPFWAKF